MELFKRALRVLAVLCWRTSACWKCCIRCPARCTGFCFWRFWVYVWLHICPRCKSGAAAARLIGGYELLLVSFLVLAAETLFYAALLFAGRRLCLPRILRRGGWRLWQTCWFSFRWWARC